MHPHYVAYRQRMHERKRRRDGARATIRRYHVPGEKGASKYHLKNGSVLTVRPGGIISAVKNAMRGIPPKTGIQRQQ